MKLDFFICPLHPRRTFRISRAAKREVRNVIVRLEHDGVVAFGEASPNPFYHETAEGVAERFRELREWISGLRVDGVDDISRIWEEVWPMVRPSRATQCALDLALWDLLAKTRGVTVSELAFGARPRPIPTFSTIAISAGAELEDAIRELRDFPRIKVKVGADADLTPVRMVRELGDALIAVDANAAWTVDNTPGLIAKCHDLGVAFVEQPLPPSLDSAMSDIRRSSPLPIIADESCVEERDLARVHGAFSGFNIKLVKCGGLTPGLRMLQHGREQGMAVMVGCMLETNVLIAAGAVVGQHTDFADLDGSWLLADDPFTGIPLEQGVLTPSQLPGWGVAMSSLSC